jgi:RND family efflux transporter MFP subunit
MRLLRKRWVMLGAILLLLAVPTAWVLARGTGTTSNAVAARVKRGDFKVVVTTAGDLRALRDIKISGPTNMQQAQIYNGVKIQTLVPEGTVVKEGDTVAVLDRSPAATKMSDVSLALQKAQAVFEQAQLDSALNLSKAREDMKTMELGLEEKRIARDQAKYEAPSVQRQAEIDLEKAQRALDQAKSDYKTKTEQAQAKMREVGADYQRQQNLLKMVQEVMSNFTITAPAPGMVIYLKEWNGKKRTAGSQIGSWDPVVATLPDLTGMQSVTYVNEIDVRKVEKGQPVTISLDADPTKKLPGKVTSVANVGEQRPNADAKVFEVVVTLEKPDTALRPGMTTGNAIETAHLKSVLHIPLEAVSSEAGVPFVFKRAGGGAVKQEIETGAMNDDEVVVVRGLNEGEEVMLAPPPNEDRLEVVRLPGSRVPPRSPSTGDTAISKPVAPTTAPKADARGGRGSEKGTAAKASSLPPAAAPRKG